MQVLDLDIRAIRCLEYLNCERNGMKSLQVNGASLKNLFASHNSELLLTAFESYQQALKQNILCICSLHAAFFVYFIVPVEKFFLREISIALRWRKKKTAIKLHHPAE